MKRNILIGVLSAACLALASASAYADNPKGYKTEAGAQKHCPGDEIVWGNVNSRSAVYHMAPRATGPRKTALTRVVAS